MTQTYYSESGLKKHMETKGISIVAIKPVLPNPQMMISCLNLRGNFSHYNILNVGSIRNTSISKRK